MVEVLAIRMKQVLGSLISNNLNAFIGGGGGQILDSVLFFLISNKEFY